MITLGKKYTDKITGFTGIATSYTTFPYRNPSVGLQPKVDSKNVIPKDEFFDEMRLGAKGDPGLDHPLAANGVEWGRKYADSISGFLGLAISRTVFSSGCVQIGLQAPMDKDGKLPKIHAFDEDRLGIATPHAQSGGPERRSPLTI